MSDDDGDNELIRQHYPDVVTAGGLSAALDLAFEAGLTKLRCASVDPVPFAYANVNAGDRHSQAMLAAEHRAFSVDFWCRGVQYGHGWVPALDEAVAAIVAFNEQRAAVSTMEGRFPWFTNNRGRLHEQGPEAFVEAAWEGLCNGLRAETADSPRSLLLPLVLEASRRAELRQLLPFTSLATLRFSRTTGYPFGGDCPVAVPDPDGTFVVRRGAEEAEQVEGLSVGEAVERLVAWLPAGCGPAIDGTADDLV